MMGGEMGPLLQGTYAAWSYGEPPHPHRVIRAARAIAGRSVLVDPDAIDTEALVFLMIARDLEAGLTWPSFEEFQELLARTEANKADVLIGLTLMIERGPSGPEEQ